MSSRVMPSEGAPRPVSPARRLSVPSDPTRGRRAKDRLEKPAVQGLPSAAVNRSLTQNDTLAAGGRPIPRPRRSYSAPPAEATTPRPRPLTLAGQSSSRPSRPSTMAPLQHLPTKALASSLFDLKGVFEQAQVRNMPEAAPGSQKETLTPVSPYSRSPAAPSGKNPARRHRGRALSSMGEEKM